MRIFTKSFVVVLIAVPFIVNLAYAVNDESENSELLMGVAPFMSPDQLFKRLTPLRIYLSKKLKREVVIELSRNPTQLIERTDKGRYDFVLTGPKFALRAFDNGMYLPGVIPGKLTTSIILVNSSSGVQSIDHLKGKVLSTPPKKGAVAHMAPNFFRDKGFKQNEIPRFIPYASHNAALLAAQNGDVDAAFIAEFAYISTIKKQDKHMREVARTKPFPGISFIVAKRLPEKLHESLITTILNLNKNSQGKEVLKKINLPAFRRSSYEEFDKARIYFGNNGKTNKNNNH